MVLRPVVECTPRSGREVRPYVWLEPPNSLAGKKLSEDEVQLQEAAPGLEGVCRAVEARTRHVPELARLLLPVVLLPDFDTIPEAQSSGATRASAAAYQLSDRRILINAAKFFQLASNVGEAVVAHEVGHAVCHRDAVMSRTPEYASLSECIVADLLACRWGFFDGLKAERLQSYGSEYCEALELWQNQPEFLGRMLRYYQRRLAGLA